MKIRLFMSNENKKYPARGDSSDWVFFLRSSDPIRI